MKRLIVLAFTLICTAGASTALASPVYKWTDKEGKVHYTSTPPSKDAKPAQLPDITRGEVKLVEQKLVTCDKHGGVNCQAGSDSDGSVICFDGFKGATARYRFTCNSPKLEIADISELGDNGAFTVFIRNAKSVEAQKPVVNVKPPEGKEVSLKGPETIPAFGVAEFQYIPASPDKKLPKPTVADVTVSCANCPA
ncbi:MAG: DUF4124 domain-containing protein [Oligoflexia bacterium]|nr:DUF4124 domain-containing protein [Oligoflexia bacterium]